MVVGRVHTVMTVIMTNARNRDMRNPSSPPCNISVTDELMITHGKGKDLAVAVSYINGVI